jgi:tetratricopeptide (TPR) repeat protein
MTSKREALALAAILAAAAVAYLPAVDGTFLLDDDALLESPLIRAPLEQPLAAWLRAPRPVTELTFALNQRVSGARTRGWHLTNVAVHLATVLLAWAIARRSLARAGLRDPALPALAAAALFALHPLQVESVAYLSQRAEALASGLLLGALLLLLARDEAVGAARRGALLAGAIGLHAVALLAKPIAATLPALWLLHAALLPSPGEPGAPWDRVRRRLYPSLPLFALSIASALSAVWATHGSSDAGFAIPGLGPARYLATQLRVIPTYLGLAAWPSGLCADWDFPASPGLADPAALAGGLLLAALAAGLLLAAARARDSAGDGAAAARAGAFGLLFFLVALTPSSSIVPLADPLAEHRVYLALLGLAIGAAAAAAWLVRRLAGARAPAVGLVLALVALVALGAATRERSAAWTSQLALWVDAARKAPGKARVQFNLGSALYYQRRYDAALDAFRRARTLSTDRSISTGQVLESIVAVHVATGRFAAARDEIEGELRFSPRSPFLLGLLAEVEYLAGWPSEGEAAARRALEADPASPVALKFLGLILVQRGDLAGARDALRRAVQARALDTSVFMALGNVEQALGNREGACAAWLRAAIEPGWEPVKKQATQARASLGCR